MSENAQRGMREIGWRKTIRIKQFLSTRDDAATARECARNIAAVLKRQREYREGEFDDFSVLVDEFEGLANDEEGEHGVDYTLTDHVNDCLSMLYDWADAERVWIA